MLTTPHTIAQGIFVKFERGHPQQGRQMPVGYVKLGDFQQITRYVENGTIEANSFY